jgi:hypothetical protein
MLKILKNYEFTEILNYFNVPNQKLHFKFIYYIIKIRF